MQPSVRSDSRGEGGRGGREGEGGRGEGREMHPRGHGRVCADALASARMHGCVRADSPCFTPGNFKKDATVRPSHGRPRGHCPIVRPFVRPKTSAWQLCAQKSFCKCGLRKVPAAIMVKTRNHRDQGLCNSLWLQVSSEAVLSSRKHDNWTPTSIFSYELWNTTILFWNAWFLA
jgi:hypothetical protein